VSQGPPAVFCDGPGQWVVVVFQDDDGQVYWIGLCEGDLGLLPPDLRGQVRQLLAGEVFAISGRFTAHF
jgi:hypothetical protein